MFRFAMRVLEGTRWIICAFWFLALCKWGLLERKGACSHRVISSLQRDGRNSVLSQSRNRGALFSRPWRAKVATRIASRHNRRRMMRVCLGELASVRAKL